MLFKASTSTNILITNKMATTTTPLAIGTRGTVGSLVRREIEYFHKLEVERPVNNYSKKLELKKKFAGLSKTTSAPPSGSRSKTTTTTLGSLLSMNWRKKRRSCSSTSSSNNNNNNNNNNSGSFLPSMCSAVEVSESKRFRGIPGYSYTSLKSNIDTDLNSD